MADSKKSAAVASIPADEPAQLAYWRDVVTEMGADIAEPLSRALERVNALVATGRIDKAGLRALREEVERARQIGMKGQLLARFASGRVKQSYEQLNLTEVLRGVLKHRSRETQARGIELRVALERPTEVLVDASMLFNLLNNTLDWALAAARSSIELRIELKSWPIRACLICRFSQFPPDEFEQSDFAPIDFTALTSIQWRLLQQTAWAMGLPLEHRIEGNSIEIMIEFPLTLTESLESALASDADDGFSQSLNSKPLAGSHVLVVASRRDVRLQVREALRDMGLIVDFVGSVDEASSFCREGLPHAIVIESPLCGERFNDLKQDIAAEVPEFVFIEIVEDSRAFEMSGRSGPVIARVGRDVISKSLPSTLLFELSRSR